MKYILTFVLLLCLITYQGYAQLVVVSAETSTQPRTQHATAHLYARNVIDRMANVSYAAAKSVELQPGFTSNPGAVFEATIQPYELRSKEADGRQFTLDAYPNPFRQDTKVDYFLPKADQVQGTLTDQQGRVISTFLNGESQEKGRHYVDVPGNDLPVGVYIYTVQTKTEKRSIRLIKSR